MNVEEASIKAISILQTIYEEREAKNIVQILFEDLFDISNLNSKRFFDFDEALNVAIDRLTKHEPVQYVTGKSNFFGFDFRVNRHVLIPRPETEELVHWILLDLKENRKQLDILDVGLGSGCIAIILKKKVPSLRIFGIDYSLDALNVARINSRTLKAPLTFYHFNFLDESYWTVMGQFDIIVSNPPYITAEDRNMMMDNVLLYEPEMALFAGDDPFIFYKALEKFGSKHLFPGGVIYIELHEDLGQEIADIFDKKDRQIEIRKDLQSKDRMMKVTFE